jgi:hypothetical protein
LTKILNRSSQLFIKNIEEINTIVAIFPVKISKRSSTQLLRHLLALNSGNDVFGSQGGHVRSRVNRGRANVWHKNAVWQPKSNINSSVNQ